MKTETRLVNSIKNVGSGFLLQFFTLALSFVVRVIFVRTIGYSYLGISSLFANILTVLSVAELGFGTSISISLYAALKKGDEKEISGIITFYKKIYLIIGGIIFVVGCVLTPFVKYIVNTDEDIPFLYLYFFIYLVNLLCTYFVSYRHAIIKADQKNSILNNIHSLVLICKSCVELVLLLVLPKFASLTSTYIVYLCVMVLSTYTTEMLCAHKAKTLYPFAFKKEEITSEEKSEIKKNVKSLFLYKLCRAVNLSIDSILISIFVSTTILGKYSNYILIINVLMGFGCLISRNVIASLGNFVLSENNDKQISMFNLINFVHILMACFFIVNFAGIVEPFFKLVFGLDSVLGIGVLIMTCVNLGFNINYQVNELFRETTKLFRKIPYISAINLFLNVVISIVLGIYFGLEGILAGTLISYFLTSFWFEIFALFKYHFKSSSKKVWLKIAYSILIISVFSVASYFITSKISLVNPFVSLVISAIISLALSCLCILSFFWFKEFKALFNIGKNLIKKVFSSVSSFLKKEIVQRSILIGFIAVFCLLIVLRDIFGIEINKFIFVGLISVAFLFVDKKRDVAMLLFLIPFHSGLPTRIIYPILAVIYLVKNITTFKNLKNVLVYFFIPLFILGAELILSTINGTTVTLQIIFSLFSMLILISFICNDKEIKSYLTLKLFVGASLFAVVVILAARIRMAAYMTANSPIKEMTFIKMMTDKRFGDNADFLQWVELWCKIEYPFKTSMLLTDNPNYIGLLMFISISICSFLFMKERSIKKKIIWVILAVFALAFGLYTGSKSFFISLFYFYVIFIIMLFADKKISLKLLLILLAGTAIVVFCLLKFVPYVNKQIWSRLNDDSGRIKLISSYFKFIFSDAKYAIFGTSMSNLQTLSGLNEPPHNSIVQIMGGYGIIGLSLVLLFGFYVLIYKRKNSNFIETEIYILTPLLAFILFTFTSQILLPMNTLIYGLPTIYIYVVETNINIDPKIAIKKKKLTSKIKSLFTRSSTKSDQAGLQ